MAHTARPAGPPSARMDSAPREALEPEGEAGAGRGVSSLERMVGLLDLFEAEPRSWSFDAIHARVGYTRSTLYRYLKILTDAELLTSLPGLGYTLGPRVAELDFQMRTHDPLVLASRPVMAELAASSGGIALLCRRYRDKVLCVHQEHGSATFRSTYERGRSLPLLRGAASRVILAHLPPGKIIRLYEAHGADFAAAGLGETLEGVRQSLKAIRADGFDVTREQVTAGVIGIAAPVFDGGGNVLGSLGLTLANKLDADQVQLLAERLLFGARIVTNAVS